MKVLTTAYYLFFYSLFPAWYTAFLSTYNICYLLSSTCFRPYRTHRPEKSRGKKIADIVRRQKSSVSSWK